MIEPPQSPVPLLYLIVQKWKCPIKCIFIRKRREDEKDVFSKFGNKDYLMIPLNVYLEYLRDLDLKSIFDRNSFILII